MAKSKEQLLNEIDGDSFMCFYFNALVFSEEGRLNGAYAQWCADHGILNNGWSVADFTNDSLERIIQDCEAFQEACDDAGYDLDDWEIENAGQHFYYTRHGIDSKWWAQQRKGGGGVAKIAKRFKPTKSYLSESGKIVIE